MRVQGASRVRPRGGKNSAGECQHSCHGDILATQRTTWSPTYRRTLFSHVFEDLPQCGREEAAWRQLVHK